MNRVIETSPRIVDIAAEPVTVDEAAQFCKIEVSDDYNLLADMIAAARAECEDFTGRGFVVCDCFAVLQNDLGGVCIPFAPVNEITALFDCDGNEITADQYSIRGEANKYIIAPALSYIKVVYNSGFEVLPAKFKEQVLNQILFLYMNRGDAPKDTYSALSPQVRAALSKYRVIA